MRADRRHQAERDRQVVVAAFLRQVGGREIDGDAARRQRQARRRPARRARARALRDTALSGRPTTLKAGRPGATCTCTSTARASMPSNATVATRWTMAAPAVGSKTSATRIGVKNIYGNKRPGLRISRTRRVAPSWTPGRCRPARPALPRLRHAPAVASAARCCGKGRDVEILRVVVAAADAGIDRRMEGRDQPAVRPRTLAII